MIAELEAVGVRQAKAQFSSLAQEVNESGRALTVMRHGKPWVTICPADPGALERKRRREAFRALTASIESYDTDPDWSALGDDTELLAQERVERFG